MGFFYTMGINFDNEQAAEICKKQIDDLKIILSDGTQVEKFVQMCKDELPSGKISYNIDVYPKGLQYMVGDEKLASKPFFYEIRTILYTFIRNMNLVFNYAFFEFEGADQFMNQDIIVELNKYGIGPVNIEGDPNASTLSCFPVDYYCSKRYLDGLIIKDEIYNQLTIDKSAFSVFRENYYWLAVSM